MWSDSHRGWIVGDAFGRLMNIEHECVAYPLP